MKSLAFIALSVIASAAMAAGHSSAPEIKITGNSVQSVSMTGAHATNKSTGTNSEALQNLASNAGDVTISGNSKQTVSAGLLSSVSNEAKGTETFASQNLSSNLGDVTISGYSEQHTSLIASAVSNLAEGAHSKAVQNIASNNACVSCAPGGHHGGPIPSLTAP